MKILKMMICCILLIMCNINVLASTANGADLSTIPLKNKEPNWYTMQEKNETSVGKNLPEIAPLTTGFYSSALSSDIDYKQPRSVFEQQTEQYRSDGYSETFYQSGKQLPVEFARMSQSQQSALKKIETGLPAYDAYVPKDEGKFDISHGQWLIDNNVYARFNREVRITGATLHVSSLNITPWGIRNSTDQVSRDEFVINLARAAYGPIESRPVYLSADAWRYARATFYWEVWTPVAPGVCSFDHYKYVEEDVNQTPEGFRKRPEDWFDINMESSLNNYYLQRVDTTHSGDPDHLSLPTGKWVPVPEYGMCSNCGTNPANPAGGCTPFVHYRGEFITNPEGFQNSIYHVYSNDMWSYTSTNVFELYIFKLISMGILDYRETFDLDLYKVLSEGSNAYMIPGVVLGKTGDTFDLVRAGDFSEQLKQEYRAWGSSSDVNTEGAETQMNTAGTPIFPIYAPELGVSVEGSRQNMRDTNVALFNHSDSLNPVSVLGRNYSVSGEGITWITDATRELQGLPSIKYFENQQMTVISALRLLERVLRVQEANMSKLEADIIAQRYGAKFVDNVPESDRDTVKFLIALGIIDFENFEEYASLYSLLTRDYAYTLLYRYANKAARTNFSQVLMTDSASLMMPGGYVNYQNSVLKDDGTALNRFVADNGQLYHNPQDTSSGELNIFSSVYVDKVEASAGTGGGLGFNPVYQVVLNIDDPLKYLYRDFPLVLTNYSYSAMNPPDPIYGPNQRGKPEIDNGLFPLGTAKMYPVTIGYWGIQLDTDTNDYFRPHPDNMFGSRDSRVIASVAQFREAVSKGESPPAEIDYRLPDVSYWATVEQPGGIGGNVDKTGILEVYKPKENNPNGRYKVVIYISAVDTHSAVNFVMANITPLTQGLLSSHEVASAVNTATGALMVDRTNDNVVGGINLDKDIVSSDRGSVFMSNTSALSGITIHAGMMQSEALNVNMINASVAHALYMNSSTEKTADRAMVQITNPLINALNNYAYNPSTGQSRELQTRMLRVSEDSRERFININSSALGDTLIGTSTFTITRNTLYYGHDSSTASRPVEYEIDAQILLTLTPNVPTLEEQNALIGSDWTLTANTSQLNNWLYTEPTNPELKLYWDYNIEVVNAILKEMGLNFDTIRSGYFIPSVTLLLDWLPGEDELADPDYVDRQLRAVERQFYEAVGKRLSVSWVNKFIGNSEFYNVTLDDLNDPKRQDEKERILESGLVTLNSSTGKWNTTRRPDNGLMLSEVSGSIPLWASLYFEYQPLGGQASLLFYHSRAAFPSSSVKEIKKFNSTTRLYGGTITLTDDNGVEYLEEEIEYGINEFGDVFENIKHTGATWVEESDTLLLPTVGTKQNNSIGKTFKHNDTDWILMGDDGLWLSLVADTTLVGRLTADGIVVNSSTGEPITLAAEEWAKNQFSPPAEEVGLTNVYDFNPIHVNSEALTHIAGTIMAEFSSDGTLTAYQIKVSGNSITRVPVALQEGMTVSYRPFIRLNKSVWRANAVSSKIEWSKSYPGADLSNYDPNDNILLLQSDLLPEDSSNRVPLDAVGQAIFQIGNLQGYKTAATDSSPSRTTVLIPFEMAMVGPRNQIDTSKIDEAIKNNSIPVYANGETFNSSEYIEWSGIAQYDPAYPYYNKTLVAVGTGNDMVLWVADKDGKTQLYTGRSEVLNVALEAILHPDLSFIVVRQNTGDLETARFDSQQVIKPSFQGARREYTTLSTALSFDSLMTLQQRLYKGMDNAEVHKSSLLSYFNTNRVVGQLHIVVWFFLVLCVVFSVLIILARLTRTNMIIYSWLSDFWDSTGIDVYKLCSVTLVTIGDEPRSWMSIYLYSLTFVLVPTLIVALLQGFGIGIL